MFKRVIKQRPFTLALIWALIIFGMCSMPGGLIPSASWLELLSFDKWVHAGIFFILCALLFAGAALKDQSFATLCFWCFLSIVYGGSLEIMQAKVFSERSADWQDFVANSFGCLVALALHKRIAKFVLR
jgi:hypothetical protein